MKEESNNYEEEDNIVELVDEEGKTFRYEHLMTFEHKGEWYVALTPEAKAEEGEEDEEGEEVAIFHLVGGEEDENLEVVEDDDLMEELFDEFCARYDDEDDEEDEENAEGGEE